MKKERQALENVLLTVIKDFSNDSKVISGVVNRFAEKGFPIGKINGIFTQAIPLEYVSDIGLCLFTKYLFEATGVHKINPDHFYNEIEIQNAEMYVYPSVERTNRIILHNVDQINEYQWLCTKETYQNLAKYFTNGLLTYNPKTQRQPLKKKIGSRIIETININPRKINEIKEEILNGTFYTNAIIFNVRRVTGMERVKYDSKNRILIIEVGDHTFVDVIDGFHRLGAMIRAIEEKPELERLTSIYIYHVDEERARAIIRQESKATPIDESWIEVMDVSNPNMEVAKSINNRQRMNEMFNRIGLDNTELRREGKLVTFDTLAKTIEYHFNLREKPIIEAQRVESFLIDLFNVVIGINYDAFNKDLNKTRKESYIADNNSFIGYVALGVKLKEQYPEDWQSRLAEKLQNIDFSKPNEILRKAGLENNINLSTVKKVSEYFARL